MFIVVFELNTENEIIELKIIYKFKYFSVLTKTTMTKEFILLDF